MDCVVFRLLNLTKISSSMYQLLLELVQYLPKHILREFLTLDVLIRVIITQIFERSLCLTALSKSWGKIESKSTQWYARYLLQQLGWKDLITQRQIQVALMVFKALNDLAPDHLSSMFTERSTSGYVLRDSTNKLNVPLPRTNYLKRSFSYRGATLWNSLPCNLRQEKSLNRFKQLLNFHFS